LIKCGKMKNKKRVALITGGSGGIGSNLCKELSKKKIIVCFTYFKNRKAAKEIANEINLLGGECYFKKMDMRSLNTNLKGPFFLTKYFLSEKNKKWCRIINISSISGVKGGKYQAHYALSKSGIISMTKSLHNLYGRKNFTINSLAPGLVNTPMIKKELKLIKNKKIKVIEPIKISKLVLSLISENKKTISGKIFFI
jgi:NAD(P)-dependent dehydrogenase (short-subunit alcohol dehydrogenase family)